MSKFTCTDCNREFNTYKSLQNHNSRTHKISGMHTHINVYHNGIHPKCKCGCNIELSFQNGKFGEYIRGHVARVNGGFYTKEGIEKSTSTRREQYKTGVRKQWNMGKQYTKAQYESYVQTWQDPIRNNKISISRKEYVCKQLGYESWQHWYDTLPDRKRYYYDVWQLTEANSHLIPGYDPELRGIAGQSGAYQIDHIIPISKGFTDGIDIHVIASPDNLRFIPWLENLQKGNR